MSDERNVHDAVRSRKISDEWSAPAKWTTHNVKHRERNGHNNHWRNETDKNLNNCEIQQTKKRKEKKMNIEFFSLEIHDQQTICAIAWSPAAVATQRDGWMPSTKYHSLFVWWARTFCPFQFYYHIFSQSRYLLAVILCSRSTFWLVSVAGRGKYE